MQIPVTQLLGTPGVGDLVQGTGQLSYFVGNGVSILNSQIATWEVEVLVNIHIYYLSSLNALLRLPTGALEPKVTQDWWCGPMLEPLPSRQALGLLPHKNRVKVWLVGLRTSGDLCVTYCLNLGMA